MSSESEFDSTGEENELHNAVSIQDFEEMERLLVAGVDLNARSSDGETALHVASSLGFLRAVELLLQFDADFNAKTDERYVEKKHISFLYLFNNNLCLCSVTPLHLAARENYVTIVELLAFKGAAVDAVDVEGFSTNYFSLCLFI